jgi:hypothetical protein
MADYGVQVEGILKPKGNFHLIEGEDAKDVLILCTDTTKRDNLPTYVKSSGLLVYVKSDEKFYKWSGTAWVEKALGGEIDYPIDSADNGLTLTGKQVKLGGTITENTNIFGKFLGLKYNLQFLDFNVIRLSSQFVNIETGNTGVTSNIGFQFFLKNHDGYEILMQQGDTLHIQTSKFMITQSSSVTNSAKGFRGNFQYDLLTDRLMYSDGTNQWKFIANTQDLVAALPKYPLTFLQQNYVDNTKAFSLNGSSNINAYFIEKATYLRSVKVMIGTADAGTNITFSIKRRNTQADGFATDFDITTGTEIWAATKTITGTGTRRKITQNYPIVTDILIPAGSLIQVGTTNITGASNTWDTAITLQLQDA